MNPTRGGGRPATAAFAAVAAALVGLLFSLTPLAERVDNLLLDAQWRLLRNFAPRPAADDIVIVGFDEATHRSIVEPPGLWHASIGRALLQVAAAKPAAIMLAFALPERSFDTVRPGLDRALMVGLAGAKEAAPLVAALNIDARTRAAKPVHLPFLAVLGADRLGIDIFSRDGDSVTRRLALSLPTEDGFYPTLEGRTCRALAKSCGEGLINYALGPRFRQVALQQLLEIRDATQMQRLFGGRIVIFGETKPFVERIEVPVNMAGWEEGARDSPAVVLHAQSLRTALLDAAPREASRPLVLLLATIAALLALMRHAGHAALVALLVIVAGMAVATASLRGGYYIPMAGPLVTLLLAVIACFIVQRREVPRR